jgi:asparagine synthase (glutamine-hydrolysing)
MCGICGTAGFIDQGLVERMVRSMAHRGPDDSGVGAWPEANVALGNCRLSILDLSAAGHMPMCNEDQTVWITYNGEVYNFPELREQLQGRGHRFRSRTDTEVIIHGYEEWGMDVLARLSGMFAFALLDLRPSRPSSSPAVLLARDRLGIKPLYFTFVGDRLLFASEVKAMLQAEDVPRWVNFAALHRYLTFLWAPGPETLFDAVYKLPPGHYLAWSDGRHRVAPYWDLRFHPSDAASEPEMVEELRGILNRSVKRHLVSDVPLGIFLSGGLDSSTNLALATQLTGRRMTAFTIAYRPEDGRTEQSDEDPKFARLVARRFGAEHHEIIVAPDIVELLPKVVWHLDEPVADPATIPTYLICEAARGKLKVLLSGQGGDEIFAGYHIYLTHRLANAIQCVPGFLRNGTASEVLRLLRLLGTRPPGIKPGFWMAAHRYLGKLLQGASLPEEERFVFYRSHFHDEDLCRLYTPELRSRLVGRIAGDRHLAYFGDVPEEDFVNRMLYVDVKTFLPELNLTYSDKLSSAASLEIRVPLLDQEVVEFMARVPPRFKLHGLRLKYLLKKTMEGVLPRGVIYRRKAAFGSPIRAWLRKDLAPLVDELLSEDSCRARGYFNPTAIRQLVERNRDGTEDNTLRIWGLLNLELWHRAFLD